MNKSKLNQCIICFFAFLIIAILIYKIITIEKFQTSTSQSTTNEVNYSPDNNQFGVNGIKKINLTQPGVYVIARPNEDIDLSAINGVDTHDYIIRLRNRSENNGYDLNVNDTLIIKSNGITVIGNSTISEESPIDVPDKWTGFITNNTVDAYIYAKEKAKELVGCAPRCWRGNYYYKIFELTSFLGFSNLIFKNIHIQCVFKDENLVYPDNCSRINYSKYASLIFDDNNQDLADGGIFKSDFGFVSNNLEFENLSFQGNIGSNFYYPRLSYSEAQECRKINYTYYTTFCGGIFGQRAFYDANNCSFHNLKYTGNIYGESCGGIFGEGNFSYSPEHNTNYLSNSLNLKFSNLYSDAIIIGNESSGIFGEENLQYSEEEEINPTKITISNCYFTGKLVGQLCAGIIGQWSIKGLEIDLINCHSKCDMVTVKWLKNYFELQEELGISRPQKFFYKSGYGNSGLISEYCVYGNSILKIINCSFEGTISGNSCSGILGNDCGEDSTINIINTFCKGSFEFNFCEFENMFNNSVCNRNEITQSDYRILWSLDYNYTPGMKNAGFCGYQCQNVTLTACYSDLWSNINKKRIEINNDRDSKTIFLFDNSCILGKDCKNIIINNCYVLTNIQTNNILPFCSAGENTKNITIKNSFFYSTSSNIITRDNAIKLNALPEYTYKYHKVSDNYKHKTDIEEFTIENVYSFSSMNEFNKIAQQTIFVGVPKDTWYLCSTPWKLMWKAQLDKVKETSLSTNLIIDNSVTLPSLENCEALGLNIRCSSTQN